MSSSDRSGLLDDAFNLARGGHLGYDIALDMTSYLHREDSYIPWKSGYRGMNYISDMFETGAQFGLWRKHVLNKVRPALNRMGWDDTGSHLQKLLRSRLIDLACRHGDEYCLANASVRFRDWLDNGTQIAPNLRLQMYKYGMINVGTSSDWDTIWDKYKTETVPQESIKLLNCLAQTRSIWLLSRYLQYTEDETRVRSQDIWTVIRYISNNPAGRSLVWDWARQNWTKLVNRFTLFSRGLGRMVPAIVSSFNTDIKLQEVENFFKKYPEAGAGARGRLQAVESIKRNINWLKTNQQTITDWLMKNT